MIYPTVHDPSLTEGGDVGKPDAAVRMSHSVILEYAVIKV